MTVGVSDGSFKDEGGTVAWIIENEVGTQRIVGMDGGSRLWFRSKRL